MFALTISQDLIPYGLATLLAALLLLFLGRVFKKKESASPPKVLPSEGADPDLTTKPSDSSEGVKSEPLLPYDLSLLIQPQPSDGSLPSFPYGSNKGFYTVSNDAATVEIGDFGCKQVFLSKGAMGEGVMVANSDGQKLFLKVMKFVPANADRSVYDRRLKSFLREKAVLEKQIVGLPALVASGFIDLSLLGHYTFDFTPLPAIPSSPKDWGDMCLLYKSQGKRPFLLMQYAQGETLEHYISGRTSSGKDNSPSLKDFCNLCFSLLDVVGRLHTDGFVHRDLKPANIMFCDKSGLLVVDLGIAVIDGLTTPHAKGSLFYEPPDARRYDFSAENKSLIVEPDYDIYSLGIIFFELAAGTYPTKLLSPEGEALSKAGNVGFIAAYKDKLREAFPYKDRKGEKLFELLLSMMQPSP